MSRDLCCVHPAQMDDHQFQIRLSESLFCVFQSLLLLLLIFRCLICFMYLLLLCIWYFFVYIFFPSSNYSPGLDTHLSIDAINYSISSGNRCLSGVLKEDQILGLGITKGVSIGHDRRIFLLFTYWSSFYSRGSFLCLYFHEFYIAFMFVCFFYFYYYYHYNPKETMSASEKEKLPQ